MAKPFSRRGLTFKQVILTLLVTLLVGGGVSALQSLNSLRAERAAAETRMALLMAAAQNNAAAAAFRLDADLADYVAAGLASSAVVAEATITDESGALLASRVDTVDARPPAWLVELAYGDLEPVTAPLYGLARPDLQVGSFTIRPDRDALASEFLEGLKVLVLLDLAKAVVLAIVLSVMFFYAQTQPLLRLVDAVRQVAPGRDQRLRNVEALLARNDEFARLVNAFDEQLGLFKQVLEERGSLLDELRLRNAALGSMDSGVAIVASEPPAFSIVDANAAMAELLDVSVDDLIGHNILDFLDRERRSEEAYEQLRGFISSGLTGTSVSRAFEFYRRAGAPAWGKISIDPVPDDAGQLTHRVIIIHDITQARETEEKLRHSQKMDALGKVTGGIAHDFNNMLAIMKGYLEIAHLDYADHTDFLESLQPIEHSVDRAAELTRRLLRFSRTTPIQEHVVHVDEAILQMREMLGSSLTPEVRIELDLAAPDCRVKLDKGDLEDALLNLAVNARDAMPQGGTLTISSQQQELGPTSGMLLEGMTPGRYLCLSVSDTGTGIDDATMKRLFEPFFTTKGEFSGTGLGLSQVYGFVERSGGRIDVVSRLGTGSTFTLYLPLETEAPPDAGDPAIRTAPPGGDETLLVVDDEPDLLRATTRILQRLGYTVIATTEPAQAIELFRERQAEIDLLLSDVVMPGGMSGHDLADTLREIEPDLPVLMVSGYDSRKTAEKPSGPLLPKPYSAEVLARAIRSVLQSKEGKLPPRPPES